MTQDVRDKGPLVARCIVCRGNVFSTDAYEVWEDAYYCERHSLPHLRERAREYAAILQREAIADQSR